MSSVSGSSGGSRGADSSSRSESSTRSESTESARADAERAAESARQAEAAKAEATKQAEAQKAAQAVKDALAADVFAEAPPAAPVDLNPAAVSMLSPTPIAQQKVEAQLPSFTAASMLSTTALGPPASFTGTLSTQGLMAAATRLETPAMREAWSGAQLAAQRAKDIATEMGFSVSSTKRTKTGEIGSKSTSDHHTSQTNAYAYDFPAEGAQGTKLAEAIAKAYGFPVDQLGTYHKQNFTFQDKDYRVQVLWGSKIDHDDHVHVGVRSLE